MEGRELVDEESAEYHSYCNVRDAIKSATGGCDIEAINATLKTTLEGVDIDEGVMFCLLKEVYDENGEIVCKKQDVDSFYKCKTIGDVVKWLYAMQK